MRLSNYPPGVTGNEPEIAGYPPCGNCGHEADDHDSDGRCHYMPIPESYVSERDECCCEGFCCGHCRRPQEQDPDEARDQQLEKEWQARHE